MSRKPPEKGSSFIALFFDNRYLLVLTMVVTFVAGLAAINGLPRLEDPVITNRAPLVLTRFPGASAEQVEALVTKKLEESLNEIDQIKNIDSTSRAGFSLISIELKDEVGKEDTVSISSEIRDKLSQASADFPPQISAPFLDDQRNAVAYTLITAIQWKAADDAEKSLGILSRRANELADQLRNINGTELVRIYGQPSEEILVTIDQEALAQQGLTAAAVAAALGQADVKLPAGQLRNNISTLQLEVDGEIENLDRIREIIVKQGEGTRTVRVGDLARVERSWRTPPDQMGYTGGQRAIFVAARVAEAERVDLWDAKAKETLEGFRKTMGDTITAEPVFLQSDYTTERLGELAWNLVLGAAVVMVVILLTMGWRRSLIVSAALPLTAAGTLFVVSLQGGKLHQMSIFGMIIALGLLIDTAIVITDEIRIELAKGLKRREALVAALRHLTIPLLSSTLTTVLAFVPILLLPGGAGDFVGSIGGSVIVAVTVSFFFSLTVIAALAAIFSAPSEEGKKYRLPAWVREGIRAPWFTKPMMRIIGLAVKFPVLGILMGIAVPAVGLALAPTLGSQFFPRTDRDMFTIEVEMSSTTSIQETVKTTREIEKILREDESVERIHWLAGAVFPPVYYNIIEDKDNTPSYAMAVLKVRDFEVTTRLVPELQAKLDGKFPQARILVRKFAQGPPSAADVEMRITGPSISELQRLGDEARLKLAGQPQVLHTEVTMARGDPKFIFKPDEAAALAAGLTPTEISIQLQHLLEGVPGGSLIEAVEELPVRVRVGAEKRDSIEEIANLRLVGSDGALVPLRAIGKFHLEPETSAITRRNNERVNTILGYVSTDGLPIDITTATKKALDESDFKLPPGYQFSLGGESENQADAVGNLLLYLPVIVTLTIATLVLSFKSLRMALILLSIAPLAVGYGLLATWVIQFPISFNTILGCIGLVGLAFNDNIVVLAAIHADKDARRGDIEAIKRVVAGTGRHLVSTTLTTIGSFLPLLIIVGGQFWPPLAVVLAGGVGGATFLAAVFTPAAYRLIAARKYRNEPD